MIFVCVKMLPLWLISTGKWDFPKYRLNMYLLMRFDGIWWWFLLERNFSKSFFFLERFRFFTFHFFNKLFWMLPLWVAIRLCYFAGDKNPNRQEHNTWILTSKLWTKKRNLFRQVYWTKFGWPNKNLSLKYWTIDQIHYKATFYLPNTSCIIHKKNQWVKFIYLKTNLIV